MQKFLWYFYGASVFYGSFFDEIQSKYRINFFLTKCRINSKMIITF